MTAQDDIVPAAALPGTKVRRAFGEVPGLKTLAFCFLAFLYLPIGVLVAYSFNEGNIVMVWTGFSTDWYAQALADADIRKAAMNSLIVAVSATAISTTCATLAALALARGGAFRGKVALLGLISLVRGGNLTEDGSTVWQVNSVRMLYLAVIAVAGFGVQMLFGKERSRAGWERGKGLNAPLIVVGAVLGSIYGGITGITEAAAMGVIAVFVIGLVRREMTFEIVWDSLMRTLKSTGTIIWVTIGAAALAAAYTLAGGPTYVANLIVGTELPTMGIILVMMLIFLVMGMFMDWVGIVLLIMPVFLPIVLKLPADQIGFFGHVSPEQVAIWFGVTFCMNMQVSFLSPPFGPAAFYLKSVAPENITLTAIFAGFMPFIAIQVIALAVILCWPPIIAVFL